jgi:hypothetical protein
MCERLPADLLDHLHGIAARSDIGNNNMSPVLSKPLRERLPDAVRPARDDRDFIVVGFGHAVTLRFHARSSNRTWRLFSTSKSVF